jgi:hypothetical protein
MLVRLQDIVMIVRMQIKTPATSLRLLMRKTAYDMTGYLAPKLPAIPLCKTGNIVKTGCTRKADSTLKARCARKTSCTP